MLFLKYAYKFFRASARALEKRHLFRTSFGCLGAVPLGAKMGNVIAVLFGSNVPFILGPVGDHYQVTG